MTTYSEQPDIMAIGDSMYQGIRSLSLLPAMVTTRRRSRWPTRSAWL